MGRELTATQLAHDFGSQGEIGPRAVRALYEALPERREVGAERWNAWLGGAGSASARIARLAKRRYCVAIEPECGERFLGALCAYYATMIRLIGNRFGVREVDADNDPFGWPAIAAPRAIAHVVDWLSATLDQYEFNGASEASDGEGDLFKPLYQELFPREFRHAWGEYYTPDWLARHVLDQVGFDGDPARRLLDPSCGSGTFLVMAIRRILARARAISDASARESLCGKILANVVGFDRNPLAVAAARVNYLVALGGLLPRGTEVAVPIRLVDTILDERPCDVPFDCVVGNPPWIAWDHLPTDYREATKGLWERYGLFTLSANEARHGGGKKDLAMLMLAVSADRYLRRGGRLAMVVTQTLFQSKGAGDGFRRFRLGRNGDPLRVLRVDDMVALKPFEDAANWTATILLEKGAPTTYPVPYVKWLPGEGSDARSVVRRDYDAEPVDASRPGSPWFLRPAGLATPLAGLIGPSDYAAHLGANSGGANGVYWVEAVRRSDAGVRVRNVAGKSKREVPRVERDIEPDLLYPLARWLDVSRYRVVPSAHIVLAQDVASRTGIDPQTMRRRYPRTLAYLEAFHEVLESRAAYRRYQDGRPFYSMYNVDAFTIAPIKVVWRRMDKRINAAVAEPVDDPLLGRRPVVPQETCALIECATADEAHYVCAVLNSSIVNFLVTSHSVDGGKGFGTPSVLDYVGLRQFDPHDRRHGELAACSRSAHRLVAEGFAPTIIQGQIDALAAELRSLDPMTHVAQPPSAVPAAD